MHKTIEPTILYFGTPVALISSLNEDGSANMAPMSSAWWLGWSCMLGLGAMGKTSDNLIRTRECVINLPSQDQVTNVDRLALTTGKDPVPEKKQAWGVSLRGRQVRHRRADAGRVRRSGAAADQRVPGADGRHRARRPPVRQEREGQLLRGAHRKTARCGGVADRPAAYRSGEVASAD